MTFDLTISQIAILAASGFIAGLVNALAGGGTFFSFAALVLCGFPSLHSTATSSVALTPGYLASIFAYREEVKRYQRETRIFALIAVVGGATGALMLVSMSDARFRPLVPWLLMAATLMFAFSPQIKARTTALAAQGDGGIRAFTFAMLLIVAIYGGFFAAGMGIMMLAALAILEEGDFHKANAIKVVMAFLIQLVSASIQTAGGLVHWGPALIIMVMSITGGYLGVGLGRRVPERYVRYGVVTAGVLLILYYFLK